MMKDPLPAGCLRFQPPVGLEWSDSLHGHRYIFKLHSMLSILEMIVSIRNVYVKQSLNDCVHKEPLLGL